MPFTPYDAATHGLDRADAMLATGLRLGQRRRERTQQGRVVVRQAVPTQVAQDMQRQALVMAVAALDGYMHRLIVARVYEHDVLPSALATLSVTFDELLAQADATAQAARRNPHRPRPRVPVKRQLRERLLRETFQNHDGVSRALAMAGVPKPWPAIARHLGMPATDVRARLNGIVQHRNQIVHEGAYARLERPQRATLTPIDPSEVQSDIAFVRRLIDGIHTLT